MSHNAGALRALIATVLVAVLALTVVATAEAGGKQGKSGKAKVTLKTTAQADLTGGGEVDATASWTGRKTKNMKLSLAVIQAGEKTNIAANRKLSVRRGITAKTTFEINGKGEPLVRSCLDTKLRLTARYSHGKKDAKVVATKVVQRDPAQCDGEDPVGVDVDTADRCDPIAAPGQQCLFPYPNDFYTRPDDSTPTGLRLDLKTDSMPQNSGGTPVDPTEINTSDGFSPGAPIVLRVPGLDTPEAFAQTDPVAITDMGESFDAKQPIVVIDAETGKRQLIWAELDSNATSPENTDLLIHFGKNLEDGHRYIVALRKLKDADGNTIEAPKGFQLLRDDIPSAIDSIEQRRGLFGDIFERLGDAGIGRHNLYMAWDFTVASTENITERMLSMRDQAFADLGDTDLTDGGVDGDSPEFTITDVTDYPLTPTPVSGRGVQNIREVTGTVKVPCYMTDPDGGGSAKACDPGAVLNTDSDGVPQQNGFYDARFTCNIPRSAVDPGTGDVTAPVRTSMYGHGLFGDYTEVHTTDVRTLGTDHGVMTCATDFIGMSEDDVLPVAVPALSDMSNFKPLPDRLQQGFLDFLYLGRAMIHPDGFAADPAFKFNGDSVIDTSKPLFYYGNSQGGIAGGALTAIATDFTRSVLYVPGMNYSTLLTRSIDFEDYSLILYPSYPDESARPLLLTMIQSMWDRGEPNGYANHMTDDPLPNTPPHKVLIEMAYGDHQVANVQTEVEARTIGAPLRVPAVDSNRLQPGYTAPFVGLQTLGDLSGPAARGSGFFIWDIGPKRPNTATPDPDDILGTDPPPLTNTAPNDSFGLDPHDRVIRNTPAIREQIANFIDENGSITDLCGPNPCYEANWDGALP
ncbi:MAG: hypothetical protein U0R51_04550 [Solirubrobacterales bacterium]